MTLQAWELAQMRTDLGKLLPDTCVIYSGTAAPDGMGGVVTTWTASGTVDCRLDPVNMREQIEGEGWQEHKRFTLTVPYDTALAAGNQVAVGTIYYAVVGVDANNSWALDQRATVELI